MGEPREREPNGPKKSTLRDTIAAAVRPLVPKGSHALFVILVPDDVMPNALDAHIVAVGDVPTVRAALRQWLQTSPEKAPDAR